MRIYQSDQYGVFDLNMSTRMSIEELPMATLSITHLSLKLATEMDFSNLQF